MAPVITGGGKLPLIFVESFIIDLLPPATGPGRGMEKGFAENEDYPLFSFGFTPELCCPGVFESLPRSRFLPPES